MNDIQLTNCFKINNILKNGLLYFHNSIVQNRFQGTK